MKHILHSGSIAKPEHWCNHIISRANPILLLSTSFRRLWVAIFLYSLNLSVALADSPPVTINESVSVCQDAVLAGSLLNGDYDPEGNPLYLTPIPVSDAQHGVFTVDASGTFTYTPNAGYSGTDQVVMNFCDQPAAGLCSNDTVFIQVDPQPSTSFAGFDIYECLAAPATINLSANSPVNGTGQWNFIFGAGPVTIVNPSDPATAVTGLTEGLYLFDWTISSGVCESSSSAVFVQITQPPLVTAGTDTILCPSQSGFTLSEANAMTYESVSWSSGGTGYFDDPSLINPTYYPSIEDLSSGFVILTLTGMGNLPCPESSDDIILTFSNEGWVNAGPDDGISTTQSGYTLQYASASAGTAVSWNTSGDGYFDNPAGVNPVYFPGVGDKSDGSVNLTIQINGASSCPGEPDMMTLTIFSELFADAGPDATSCSVPFTITGATAANYSSLQWNHSGNGFLLGSETIQPTYYPGVDETGQIILTLTAYGLNPAADSLVDHMSLTLSLPTASISGNQDICYGGSAMLRFDLTGTAPWLVTFSDGTSEFTENILTTPYLFSITPEPGVTTFHLTSLSDATCNATQNQISGTATIITHSLPEAMFDASDVCFGSNVQFTDLSTGNSITTWSWDFGNLAGGSPVGGTQQNPEYSYNLPGNYTARLIIVDTFGCSDTVSKAIQVFENPFASYVTTPQPGSLTVDFKPSGTYVTGHTFEWDFGDGKTLASAYPVTSSNHIYNNPGYYLTSLKVKDSRGCESFENQELMLGNIPVIELNMTLESPAVCMNTYATAHISIKGEESEWILNWGDGSDPVIGSTMEESVNHLYSEPGTYLVSVNGSSSQDGIPVSGTVMLTISVKAMPNAYFDYISTCEGVSTTFTAMIQDNSSDGIKYSWDFGDPATNNDTSTLRNPEYLYSRSGSYTASLIVTNQGGCNDTIQRNLEIHSSPLAEVFVEQACPGTPTGFSAEPLTGSSYPLTCNWSINSILYATISSKETVYATFATPGTFPLQLEIIDANGCKSHLVTSFTIAEKPLSVFSLEENYGHSQGKVLMHNGSLNAQAYVWDFGNGESSNEASPVVNFTENGEYKVRLIAYNQGCADTSEYLFRQFYKGLYVPNAFAGERWKPAGEGLAEYKAEIFDRWGKRVWSASLLDDKGSPEEGWDGTFQGIPVPAGTYIWKISAVFQDGQIWKNEDVGKRTNMPNLTTGTITLFR